MEPGHVRLVVLAAAMSTVGGLSLWGVGRLIRRASRPLTRVDWALTIGALASLAIGVACFGWAFIEADWLSETRIEVDTAKLPAGKRLRIVHLSDLHVDHARPLFDEVRTRVNALKPDLLVFTGDSLNDREGLPAFQALLSGVEAPVGRFAVRGNHDTGFWAEVDLFGGGVATELKGQSEDRPAANLSICGAPYDSPHALRDCLAATAPGRFVIAAYHTPDLAESMRQHPPDLYLAGHTHGGQVRMPFYGALITLSDFDKKYEMGRAAFGPTTIFVSRGVGVEPEAPRIRFLCRPEVAVIDLVGTGR